MKSNILTALFVAFLMIPSFEASSQSKLKIVIIRHGEKQEKYENLNCMGLNRSLKLINVLHQKIGLPDYIYVPSVGNGSKTTHSRMFQTISPFAINYNLSINSSYQSTDLDKIVKDLEGKKGLVLFVWNHESIMSLAKALGIKGKQNWGDNDYDSMWIITGKGKNRVLQIDREGISPGKLCGTY